MVKHIRGTEVLKEGKGVLVMRVNHEINGLLLVKVYILEEYLTGRKEPGGPEDEVAALQFWSEHKVPFQIHKVILTESTEGYFSVFCNWISGHKIANREWNPAMITNFFTCLTDYWRLSVKSLVDPSLAFQDVNEIQQLCSCNSETLTLFVELMSKDLESGIRCSSKALLHGDIHDQNVLWDQDSINFSLIDFGDAHQGYLVLDIALTVMEVSFVDNVWSWERYRWIIHLIEDLLRDLQLNIELLVDSMMLQCLVFSIYTNSNSLDTISNREYIEKFNYLKGIRPMMIADNK